MREATVSAYTEFIEDVERRKRRLARQQFWAATRIGWRREELRWKIFFIAAAFLFLAVLLLGAMMQDGCQGPKPGGRTRFAPSMASSATRA